MQDEPAQAMQRSGHLEQFVHERKETEVFPSILTEISPAHSLDACTYKL